MSINDEKKSVSVAAAAAAAAAATAVPAVSARVKRASIAILTFKGGLERFLKKSEISL